MILATAKVVEIVDKFRDFIFAVNSLTRRHCQLFLPHSHLPVGAYESQVGKIKL